mgnify:FL=1
MGNIGRLAARQALENVGVVEEGENRGRWVEMYQAAVGIPPGSPWCAAFVRFRLEKAAERLDKELPEGFPDSGWVPSYEAWAKRNGLWVSARTAELDDVEPGDLAVFWFEAKQRCAHIGIVVECPSTGIWTTVEGNTGPDMATSINRDGDGVYQKRRTRAMLGSRGGFVKIKF